MKIDYTIEEAQAQLALNDMAVKAGGMQVAEAALILSKKLQDGIKADQAPTQENIQKAVKTVRAKKEKTEKVPAAE